MKAIKKDGKYHNIDFVQMQLTAKKTKAILKNYLVKKDATPHFSLPRKSINTQAFHSQDSLVWLGHSSILANLDGVRFIVDPMLSQRASPLKHFGPKRFEGSLTPIEELGDIDVILITHNHYDHLDKQSVLALAKKAKKIFVPLDNAKLLLKWGLSKEKVQEFDWFEEQQFKTLRFTFCPTQHFSGRSLSDRNKYLWGSWAIKGQKHNMYVSGDSGYNAHFKLIGERLGPFDVACMECGAYNESWSEVHMLPEESVQASLDLQAKQMLPMHWAGFDLSAHAWDEPISRALLSAKTLGVTLSTPLIGEVLSFEHLEGTPKWWQKTF